MAPENPDGPEEERVQGGRTSAVWADTEVTAELGSAVTGGRSLTAERQQLTELLLRRDLD